MRIIMTIFMVLSVGLVTGVNAQNLPNQETIDYFNSEPYKKLILMTGMIFDENFGRSRCNEGYSFEPISFSIRQPLIFSGTNGHPISGMWTYRFKFQRCGETIVYNVLWWQGHGSKLPTPSMLIPGTTRTSQMLASDLLKAIAASAVINGAPSDCKKMRVLDTRVTAEPSQLEMNGKTYDQVWEEQWDVNACSKKFSVDFCLVPETAGGTTWSIGKCRK